MNQSTVIVGGGISGLAALHYLKTKWPDSDVTLYESSHRPGGVIGTDIIGGYVCEWGPAGILDKGGLCRKLSEELGISDLLEIASDAAKNRYVFRNNRLCPVPLSPATFLTSKILTPIAKLRMLLEPFTSSSTSDDESIYDFFNRHIGAEATEYLIQPMVTGIFAGRAEMLSIKACFPKLHEMDKTHGSLILGALKSRFRNTKSETKAPKSRGSMRLLSFKQKGISILVETLSERYKTNIRTSMPVVGIKLTDSAILSKNRWNITLKNGAQHETDNVILAVPAYQASLISNSHSQKLSELLKQISYTPLIVVCLGYPLSDAHIPLDGFGFLVPPNEEKNILGAIWTSSVFGNRVPDHKFQLRVILGDSDSSGKKLITLSDKEILNLVKSDINNIMRIDNHPEMIKIYRHERAIPEYKLGHPGLLEQIKTELDTIPGLQLIGNYTYGVGVNDCLNTAIQAVNKIAN